MHRRQTTTGTWLYIPAPNPGPDADGNTSSSTSSSTSGAPPAPRLSRRQRRALRTRAGPPPDSEGQASEVGEWAESERPTNHPIVDPDHFDFDAYRRRAGARGLPLRRDPPQRVRNAPVLPQHHRGKLGSRTTDAAKQVKTAPEADEPEHPAYLEAAALKGASPAPSWNSRMGPERQVKWRGGTPPTPPVWRYDRDDLRAFAKWTRKVRIWEVQIAPYMPKKEASLLLYNSLTGELEAELEHAPLERINSSEGIEFIISSLQAPMEQKAIFQKRRYLADFEQIGRYANESMRSYVNRYKRAERNLGAVGVEVSAMYDSDARGNRLLERAKLGTNDQRLILVGSRYSLAFEDVSESMCMQFPDFRPPPSTVGRDGQPVVPKGTGKHSGLGYKGGSSSTSSWASSPGKGAKDSGKGSFKKVWVVDQTQLQDIPEEQAFVDDDQADDAKEDDLTIDHDQEEAGDQEQDENEADDDLADLAQVLTVTARRLSR